MRDSLVKAAAAADVPVERFHPVRHPRWQEPSTFLLEDSVDALEVLRSVLPTNVPVWFVAEDFGRTKERGGEHHLFEYYIVGRKLGWMVAENHHDVLMAVGEPVASRLDALRPARAASVT